MHPTQARSLRVPPAQLPTARAASSGHLRTYKAPVAQLAEQLICNRQAGGSTPSGRSKHQRVAQLVERSAYNRRVAGSIPAALTIQRVSSRPQPGAHCPVIHSRAFLPPKPRASPSLRLFPASAPGFLCLAIKPIRLDEALDRGLR